MLDQTGVVPQGFLGAFNALTTDRAISMNALDDRFALRFEDPGVERDFLDQYRRGGLRFVKFALFLGAGLCLIFFALVLFIGDDESPMNPRQTLRLMLFAATGCLALLLVLRPNVVLAHYVPVIGGTVALAAFSIGAMSLLPADLEESRSGRWTVAMSLTCWLAFGFTRLPAYVVAVATVSGSVAILVAAHTYGDEYVRALFLYLLMANLIGWIMSVEIERRERALFWSTRQLTEATDALELMARNASEANSARSRVLAAVSHDLRQPLASLSLYAQLLRSNNERTGAGGPANTVDRIEACVAALKGNLDRLSELGGLRSGLDPLPVEPVSLDRVLERIESVYAAEAANVGARLVVRRPGAGRQYALSNETRLWDVLANLTGNALKFGGGDRRHWVLLRVRRSGSRLVVDIRDNGIGIAPADQRRVFDEYFQIGNHARNRERGFGLGLSIARETTLRLPGHSITLTSRPGCGTRFSVSLPAADSAPPADADVSPAAAAAEVSPGETLYLCESPRAAYAARSSGVLPAVRIETDGDAAPETGLPALAGSYVLFVEDDDSMRHALGQVLEQWGILVDSAADGEEALRIVGAAERVFDAIVSDYRLPGARDGLRLIDEVREREGQRTPAVLLSGEFSVDSFRAKAPNDVAVMPKPPDLDALRRLLTRLVGRSRPVLDS